MNNEFKKKHNKFLVALNGVIKVFNEESSFRYQWLFLLMAVILGFILKISLLQWVLIIISAVIVFVLEMMNTAIENIIDIISPEYSEMAGKIKDISAGAVLIAAVGSTIIGMIIFLPKIFNLI